MDRLRELFGGEAAAALFVDGPNVLREEFEVDLDEVRETAAEAGRLAVARVYLDQEAPPALVQAAEARGFDVRVTAGDVDVKLAVDAATFLGETDVLAVATRDADFKPLLEQAASRGVHTLVIAPGAHGRSDALCNAAHEAVTLEE